MAFIVLWRPRRGSQQKGAIDQGILDALGDDLNTPKAMARLHELGVTRAMMRPHQAQGFRGAAAFYKKPPKHG